MLKAINIKWDIEGDMEVLNELPEELVIPDDLEELYKNKEDREYALEYCECDEDGEFIQGADFDLAEEK